MAPDYCSIFEAITQQMPIAIRSFAVCSVLEGMCQHWKTKILNRKLQWKDTKLK